MNLFTTVKCSKCGQKIKRVDAAREILIAHPELMEKLDARQRSVMDLVLKSPTLLTHAEIAASMNRSRERIHQLRSRIHSRLLGFLSLSKPIQEHDEFERLGPLLTFRTWRILAYTENVRTIGEVLLMSDKQLLKIQGFGRKSLADLDAALSKVGLERERSKKKPIAANDPKLRIFVEEMELSIRTYNALKIAGFKTAGDLVTCCARELSKRRNFGRSAVAEISCALAAQGLEFGMEIIHDNEASGLSDRSFA